ncbi:hypothetical protein SD81_037040 [Tolypothrix campylonemoides VB511288]|nr:hypothetical protein SD81_037040 [Tolypothrix campylonemoides VB511288]
MLQFPLMRQSMTCSKQLDIVKMFALEMGDAEIITTNWISSCCYATFFIFFNVDWDTLRIAPRERDLLFIIGSTIARRVTPQEEAQFFQGYGATSINWQALVYYRYERALEDLYEGGRSVFFNSLSSPAVKEADAELTMSLFQPGAIVQSALAGDNQLNHSHCQVQPNNLNATDG